MEPGSTAILGLQCKCDGCSILHKLTSPARTEAAREWCDWDVKFACSKCSDQVAVATNKLSFPIHQTSYWLNRWFSVTLHSLEISIHLLSYGEK